MKYTTEWKDTYGVTVYIGGEKVWENGKMVKHNMDITAGSYENGVAEGSENKYTDGYKDNAFDRHGNRLGPAA